MGKKTERPDPFDWLADLDSTSLVDIWQVYMQIGRYDNNMFVRAPNKKEAYRIAYMYADETEGQIENKWAERILDFKKMNFRFLGQFLGYLYDGEEWAEQLYWAKIEGCCYDSGT